MIQCRAALPVTPLRRLNSRYLLFACLLSVAFGLLPGCAGHKSRPMKTSIVAFTPEEMEVRDQARQARYRIRVGDVLGVNFKYQDELDAPLIRVLPDGTISMNGVEDLAVAGLTLATVDSLLTERFADDYLMPDLSVSVKELGPSQVYVLGEVTRPGLMTIPQVGGGVLQAVAMAGGFTDLAAASETVLIRVTDQGYMFRSMDLSHLEKGLSSNMAMFDLQPYDIVYVPRSAIGDFSFLRKNLFEGLLDISDIIWDVYALANLDKVDRILR